MGKGGVENGRKIEDVSLDIANYWVSNGYLTEANKNCGTLVAFDWRDDYLTEINTNIDLVYTKNFKFDVFMEFLKKNNFTFVLGLRNIEYLNNPSVTWTDKLKETLKSNEIDYDEYVVNIWPSEIPEFDIPDYVFILRYSYDIDSKIDKFASNQLLFEEFIKKSDWEEYYKDNKIEEKTRVIVLCSDVKNLILHNTY